MPAPQALRSIEVEPIAFDLGITVRGVDCRLSVCIPVEVQAALLGADLPCVSLPATCADTARFDLAGALGPAHAGLHQIAEMLFQALSEESSRILGLVVESARA